MPAAIFGFIVPIILIVLIILDVYKRQITRSARGLSFIMGSSLYHFFLLADSVFSTHFFRVLTSSMIIPLLAKKINPQFSRCV